MEYILNNIKLLGAGLPIFGLVFAIIKKGLMTDIEKRIEPHYLRISKRIVIELIFMIFTIVYIPFIPYLDSKLLVSEVVFYGVFMLLSLITITLLMQAILHSLRIKIKVALFKYIRFFLLSKRTIFTLGIIQFSLIILSVLLFNNKALHEFKSIEEYRFEINQMIDILLWNIAGSEIDTASLNFIRRIIFIVYIEVYFMARVIFFIPLCWTFKKMGIISENKDYINIKMKSGDKYENMNFITRNSEFIILRDEKLNKSIVLFNNDISVIEINKIRENSVIHIGNNNSYEKSLKD